MEMKIDLALIGARLAFIVTLGFISLSGALNIAQGAEFSCPSGNVTCLIAAINSANAMTGNHIINLEPGTYALQIVDNTTEGPNGLPSIKRSILIEASVDGLPTVIERDANAPGFRIIHVSIGGELRLKGITVQGGGPAPFAVPGAAILNRGVISLEDSNVTNSRGEGGAIHNFGTLNLFGSIVSDNRGGHDGGGIVNDPAGSVVLENSTIANNAGIGPGGIANSGSLVIRNSAIFSNQTDSAQPGGGIGNFAGSVTIINSTIARNLGGGASGGGGGVSNKNGGLITIINSTIRENRVNSLGRGGGISNLEGTVKIQNTIVAGNTIQNVIDQTPDCLGVITSLGNNFVGDPTGCGINFQPTDMTGDPGLGVLVGTEEDALPGTAHYPVLAGSPVIGKGNPTACPQTDQLGNSRDGICDIGSIEFQSGIPVAIDIEPKDNSNSIRLKGNSTISVAILGAANFDPSSIDSSTVVFGRNEASAGKTARLRDVNGDGRLDLILGFKTRETGVSCGDTSLFLRGQTSQGDAIFGSDFITPLDCENRRHGGNKSN